MHKYFNYNRFFHTSSSYFIKRLTKKERSQFKLESYLRQVLIGNILGDVKMRRFYERSNVRIVFRQGYLNASDLLHLYSVFQDFVSTPPSIDEIKDKETGYLRYNISFTTLALPCLNDLYESF